MLSRLADFIQSPAFREAARRDPRHFTRQRDLPFPELIAFLLSGVRGAVQGVRAIHAEIRGAYGSPRMVRELRSRGFPASKGRVERLMRENSIHARHKRRYKVTTDSKHGLPVADNLLDRNFTPAAPNQLWTSDITYLWTDAGWLYLAIVLDLFNREVVGWSLKPRMTADIVTDALTMAWFRKRPAAGLRAGPRNSDSGISDSLAQLQAA